MTIGTSDPGRATAPRTPAEVKAAEAELDAERARNLARGTDAGQSRWHAAATAGSDAGRSKAGGKEARAENALIEATLSYDRRRTNAKDHAHV